MYSKKDIKSIKKAQRESQLRQGVNLNTRVSKSSSLKSSKQDRKLNKAKINKGLDLD